MTGGPLAPAVADTYAPGRGGPHGAKLLDGFKGVPQVDGSVYPGLRAGAVYKTVARLAAAKAVLITHDPHPHFSVAKVACAASPWRGEGRTSQV